MDTNESFIYKYELILFVMIILIIAISFTILYYLLSQKLSLHFLDIGNSLTSITQHGTNLKKIFASMEKINQQIEKHCDDITDTLKKFEHSRHL